MSVRRHSCCVACVIHFLMMYYLYGVVVHTYGDFDFEKLSDGAGKRKRGGGEEEGETGSEEWDGRREISTVAR